MKAQRTPTRLFSLVAGIFLVALGVLTLVLERPSFSSTSGLENFLIWNANFWTTILWIVMGALGIFASTRVDMARTFGLLAAAVFGVMAVWGFIGAGTQTVGIFGFGTVDNITSAVIAILGALTALMPASMQRRAGVGTSSPSARAT